MRFDSRPTLLGLACLLVLLGGDPVQATAAASNNRAERLPVNLLPGAKVLKRSTRSLDEYWIPLGRLTGDGQAVKDELLEGKWTHVAFDGAGGRSVAEVFRHYEQQVAKAGLEVMYTCKGVACGEGGRKTNGDWWTISDNRRYLAARLQRPGGDLWVSVHVHARTASAPVEHEVDVVEVKPPVVPPPPRNEADVATLEKELKANGRVVLRSIGFVDRRPDVLPESEGVVKAIAELLARDPGLKLHVVVHSDDATPAAASLDLTKKRAGAVVTLLTRKHRVQSARVHPAGVGPLAPVASNGTEEGRSMNRRVELVPQSMARGREAAASVGR